ncbi:MAG: F0F1 ATP synthase subunit A [Flavobacteriales bacterium]|nr:F0F1 ATP synthase subunit A [Flavobacteriales bacterium]
MNKGKNNVLRIISTLVLAVIIATASTAQGTDSKSGKELKNTHVVINNDEGSLLEQEQESEKVPFSAAELIMEHISDSHEWHVWGSGKSSFSIPLPIILYHEDRGFSCFMSSNFHHGHDSYDGYVLLTEHFLHIHDVDPNEYPHDRIVAISEDGKLDEESTAKIWDISITKNVFALLTSVFLLMLIFISIARSYKKKEGMAPKGLQSFLEPVILFVRDDIAKPSIGEDYARFMPFLLTVFFFIWINNIMGLIPIIPGGANLTGNIVVPMVLALFTFVITTINGKAHYWKHIIAMPGVPKAVLLILTPIELIGIFVKPITLIMRLFANITAGHIVMLVFFSLIFLAGDGGSIGMGYGVGIASTAFTIFLTMLEILVGAIQAYVFTLLSAIYFGMAVKKAHH